jgi:hypothetical protein
LLRYFLFIAEDLDQFTFVYGGAHAGRRGEKLFCDHPPSFKLIWPDIGALTLGKAENKDADRPVRRRRMMALKPPDLPSPERRSLCL